MRFHDRADAGRQLAAQLTEFADRPGVIVLGLPRGGIPVAYEVAVRLKLPLDAFLVRKLGVPGRPELAMGAIVPRAALRSSAQTSFESSASHTRSSKRSPSGNVWNWSAATS